VACDIFLIGGLAMCDVTEGRGSNLIKKVWHIFWMAPVMDRQTERQTDGWATAYSALSICYYAVALWKCQFLSVGHSLWCIVLRLNYHRIQYGNRNGH